MSTPSEVTSPRAWGPWRFVAWFGVVSLLADVVYEGARSITGPYLASLGASALVVGLITGIGEAAALIGRLGSGPLADRTRAYWPLAIGGYVMTVVAVPLLGLTSALWIAAGLVIAERAGKALRSPAKDVMLSHATSAVGRGRGFALHEALDQIGAVAGPLAVAAVFAVTGSYAPTFGMLAVPGAAAIVVLLWLRRRVPDPASYEESPLVAAREVHQRHRLTGSFWWYMAFTATTTIGYGTFAVLSFHLVKTDLVHAAVVPVLYAVVMGVDAVAALVAGHYFDKRGRRVLLVVPVVSALIPLLAFSSSLVAAIAGLMLWGVVMGVQESVMRAAIADLVPSHSRGTAYGIFAAGFGVATLVGGVLTGALYDVSIPLLIAVVIGIEVIAMLVLFKAIATSASAAGSTDR